MTPTLLDQWKYAVQCGLTDHVRNLFRDHAELVGRINDPVFSFDSTAVFHARENIELLDLLIEHGADLNRKTTWWAGGFGILEGLDAESAAPLIKRGAVVDIWAAVSMNDTATVKRLLDENPDCISARGGDGKHPLHYAPDAAMVDLLVARGADVNARDIDHESTPAQWLVNNEPVVRRLLHHGAEPDVFLAAALGDADLVKRCLEVDPDCSSGRLGIGAWSCKNPRAGGHIYSWELGHDATPLDVARERGHDAVLALLLEHSSPFTRLRYAIWHGDRDEVESIRKSDPEAVDRLRAIEPAMMARAAWWYRPDAVKLLLELGFDRHAAGVHDSTPLDRAAFHGYADVVAALLDGDDDPPLARLNEFGGTPLTACMHGAVHGWETGHPQNHARTVELLIAAGSEYDVEWVPTGSAEVDAALLAEGETDEGEG